MYFLSFPEVHIFFSPATQTRLGEESLLVASWWFFTTHLKNMRKSNCEHFHKVWGKNNKYIETTTQIAVVFVARCKWHVFLFSGSGFCLFWSPLHNLYNFSRAKISGKKLANTVLAWRWAKKVMWGASSHIFTLRNKCSKQRFPPGPSLFFPRCAKTGDAIPPSSGWTKGVLCFMDRWSTWKRCNDRICPPPKSITFLGSGILN